MTVITSSHSVEVTHNITFTAIANGVGVRNFTYQWLHQKYEILTETDTTLTIINAMEYHGGEYSCLVTNIYGDNTFSNVVTLIVSSKLFEV